MVKYKKLKRSFYLNPNVVEVSKSLLGKYLVTNIDGQITSGKITETEAYQGPEDKASHAWNNRYTERTKIMYEQGGTAYVYIIYGIHHLFNVVTNERGIPHAVLIRAIEPVDNIELMLQRRNFRTLKKNLTAGPGVLSAALGVKTIYSGIDILEDSSPIWIEDRGDMIKENDIIKSKRIGVDYAGEWALKEWRFRIKNSKWTS